MGKPRKSVGALTREAFEDAIEFRLACAEAEPRQSGKYHAERKQAERYRKYLARRFGTDREPIAK